MAKKAGRPLNHVSQEMIIKIYELRKKGMTHSKIARELGLTQKVVENRLRMARIKTLTREL